NIEDLITKAKRTDKEIQILGCDVYHDSYKEDILHEALPLYIGDGLFHPKALLLAQQNAQNKKDVIMFDPISDSVKVLTQKDIENQKKKYHSNMVKYMHAKNVGVLVSTKTGQQYLNSAMTLKSYAGGVDKNFFIFVGDTFNMREMENFPFIEAWVNTACPRIGTDDIVNLDKPLININDALRHAQQNIAEVNVKVEDSAKPIYAKNIN
ncbi:MAG: diphthamide synthesis protein, partial [Bacteroidetes bacterium]|nr:diphthamide synthesis protein [Bacteroidota bacterium]